MDCAPDVETSCVSCGHSFLLTDLDEDFCCIECNDLTSCSRCEDEYPGKKLNGEYKCPTCARFKNCKKCTREVNTLTHSFSKRGLCIKCEHNGKYLCSFVNCNNKVDCPGDLCWDCDSNLSRSYCLECKGVNFGKGDVCKSCSSKVFKGSSNIYRCKTCADKGTKNLVGSPNALCTTCK